MTISLDRQATIRWTGTQDIIDLRAALLYKARMAETVHTITAESAESRLDKFLTRHLPQLSRSRIQALIADGHVSCNDAPALDGARKVKPGQTYRVTIPEIAPSHIVAQDIPLTIIYEDYDLLVINKPPGLTVHPAPGHPDKTLVNALLSHCGASLSGIGGVARPGIVHRLDKDTSGLLVAAKNDHAHAKLSSQLADRSLKRVYLALAWGVPKQKQGTITGNIGRSPRNRKKMAVLKTGGREAVTHYRVVSDEWLVASKNASPLATRHSPLVSLIECRLETGRTHQIRVHLAHIGHPLVGDPVYGGRKKIEGFTRQALHAKEIGFIHPRTGKKMHFECELPEDMKALLATLR